MNGAEDGIIKGRKGAGRNEEGRKIEERTERK
jgi:hypothetical protein